MEEDFLSKVKEDKSNPHAIIPISFDLQEILQEKYLYTRSAAEKEGITVGKVHGCDKLLLPHIEPEKNSHILSLLPLLKCYPLLNPKVFSQ